jgi:hypothetical protein
MAVIIQTNKLLPRLKNDTFASVDFKIKNFNTGLPIDLTDVTAQMQFRYNTKLGSVVKDVSVGSGLTITDAENGWITLDAFTPVSWEIGCYHFDLPITYPSGVIKTYNQGTVEIIQDTTDD